MHFSQSSFYDFLHNSFVSQKPDTPTLTKADESELISAELLGRYGQLDLSRLPPTIAISDPRARAAIREEIKGILDTGEDRIPIGRLVALNSEGANRAQRLHTTIGAKIKPGKGFKLRLCIRGDMQIHALAAFTSAPSTGGECLRAAAFLMSNEESPQMKMVDASQAFTQSDLYNAEDRALGILLSIVMDDSPSWNEAMISDRQLLQVEDANGRVAQYSSPRKSSYGVLLYKPLYGTRDDPTRW